MTGGASRSQRGFALVAALFFMVVLATLGAYAVRLNMSQQGSTDLDLAAARAEAAVQTGIQYAAARVLTAGSCTAFPLAPDVALNLPQNFAVTLTCDNNETLVANAPTVTVFLVTATATRGQYGSPDFVSRQRTVRITTP
jgi:MSHA biogenesis protein MshP